MTSTPSAGSRPRVALVTGASRGIGAATVRCLAQGGWATVLNHRDSASGAEAVVQSLPGNARVTVLQADVGDRDDVLAMCARVRQEYGSLDALVHNAAVPLSPRRLARLEWDRDLAAPVRVALGGFVNCVGGVMPFLAEDARIVGVLTDALIGVAPAQMGAYLAAKGALWGALRALAADQRGTRRIVFGVSPGMANTALLDGYGERALELIAQDLPGGHLADPETIGQAIARLVLEPPPGIHGQNVPVG